MTRRFQRWCQARKMQAIGQQHWGRLTLLIFANNLGAVALVGRTIYSLAVAPAVYLTYRQGLGQGTLAAQLSMASVKASPGVMAVAVLEFGAHVLATALGVNRVLSGLAGTFEEGPRSLVVFYPIVGSALPLGASLEVQGVHSNVPSGFTVPENMNADELRAKAVEMLARRSL